MQIAQETALKDAIAAPDRAETDLAAALSIYNMPFMDLLHRAHTVHRAHFDPNRIQLSQLLSIKTGGCPEDCAYCGQSARNGAQLPASKLMEVERVLAEARKAKAAGATRYCMGAAWREPKDRDLPVLEAMIRGVRDLGLESCMTLGMLSTEQARRLSAAGLDYSNPTIDTSEAFYPEVIGSRTFGDRIETLARVREAGIKVCSGGILGMGEAIADRVAMLLTLAQLPKPPDSVPINLLMPQAGTPLAKAEPVDPIALVRLIALGRILMPRSVLRLSAGRTAMSDELQAMCFFAGANSIFMGDKLLTAGNPEADHDRALFDRLGLRPEAMDAHAGHDDAGPV